MNNICTNITLASGQRMWAISLRHLRQMRKDVSKLINVFYWPFLDVMLWGFTAQWVQSGCTNDPHFTITMLTAVVAWQLFVRTNLDVSTNLLEDIQDSNVVNLFASPLALHEWVGGILILTALNTLALLSFCSVVVWLLYQANVMAIGIRVIPFIFNLLMTGLSVGFLGASLLISYGKRMLGIIYMLGWFFSPFSGAFFPIVTLPFVLRIFAQMLPISYTIEGIRTLSKTGVFSLSLWFTSFLLSILFITVSFSFFIFMFMQSKRKGLQRLAD